MDSLKDVNLLILSIEKTNIIHKKHNIPKDIESIDDLYLMSIDNNLIKPKEMFYFINNGQLLKGEDNINNITTDIILLTCTYLTEYKLSSIINSNNSLMQDISDIITRQPTQGMGNITSYLNTNMATLSSQSSEPLLSQTSFFPYETAGEISSTITNSLAANILVNSTNTPHNITSGSQLMNEFTNTINSMLNSVNVVIEPTNNMGVQSNTYTSDSLSDLETPGISDTNVHINTNNSYTSMGNPDVANSTEFILDTSINNEVSNDLQNESGTHNDNDNDNYNENNENNDNNNDNENNDNNNNDNENNDIGSVQIPNSLIPNEGTHLNDEGTNINSVNNTISQLLNIYQSSDMSDSLSNVREQYSQQFDEIYSMGFTDENKIIIALYVCEGNCENAINYYLSLQGDL